MEDILVLIVLAVSIIFWPYIKVSFLYILDRTGLVDFLLWLDKKYYKEKEPTKAKEDYNYDDIQWYDVEDNNELFNALKRDKLLYISSPKWQAKRDAVLMRDLYTCQCCGASSFLEVHHIKDYALIPNEPEESLVTLCRSCHQIQHDHYGYPDSYEAYIKWNAPLINIQDFKS